MSGENAPSSSIKAKYLAKQLAENEEEEKCFKAIAEVEEATKAKCLAKKQAEDEESKKCFKAMGERIPTKINGKEILKEFLTK